jgi:adenine-specific DNA-methyltransferase
MKVKTPQIILLSGKNRGKVYEQFYKGEKLRLLTWLSDVLEIKDDILYKKDLQGTFWDGLNLNNLTKEGSVEFPNGKKARGAY